MADVEKANFRHTNTSQNVTIVTLTALWNSYKNYMYVIICNKTKKAAVTDPVDYEKVLAFCDANGLDLIAALTTHNHHDHAGGNKALKAARPSVTLYGGKGDNAPGVKKENEVGDGDIIKVGELDVNVLFTPCHTPGHVCYLVDNKEDEHPNAVFTGDTIFIGGCGFFFRGTPAQMSANFRKLGNLPKETLVYAGHEYTVGNLEYGRWMEPRNDKLLEKLAWAKEVRKDADNGFCVPSTIGEEHETNPFMRSVFGVKEVCQRCKTTDPAQAIKWVRLTKNDGAWKNDKL